MYNFGDMNDLALALDRGETIVLQTKYEDIILVKECILNEEGIFINAEILISDNFEKGKVVNLLYSDTSKISENLKDIVLDALEFRESSMYAWRKWFKEYFEI